MQIAVVTGLAEDSASLTAMTEGIIVAAIGAHGFIGFGLDTTTAFTRQPARAFNVAAQGYGAQWTAATSFPPQIGFHTYSLNQQGDGTNANTFNRATIANITAAIPM